MFTTQLTLPGIEKFPIHKTRKALGIWGEIRAKRWLEQQDYGVKLLPIGDLGDLRVKNLATGTLAHIEVKTAKRSQKYGFWQFPIWHRTTDYRKADYLLLQAIVDDCGGLVRFFIPTSDLHQHQIVMRNPYSQRSKFTQYRVNGDIEL